VTGRGRFALTVGLHRFLATANGARVVSLSSSANMIAPVIFDDLHFNFLPYAPFVAYGPIEDSERFIWGGGYAPLDG
jgi:hypothetical protein